MHRAYLRDVIETTHLFFKMLEKFCQGTVRVQGKKRAKPQKKSSKGAAKQKEIDVSNKTFA
jgi:timeless